MQTAIPCLFMRGGTSRGPFFNAADLPADIPTRDKVLLAVMGSPDKRQIDGLGGAHPLTSKVGIVSKGSRPGVDLDFLFAQLQPDKDTVDTTPGTLSKASSVHQKQPAAKVALARPWACASAGSSAAHSNSRNRIMAPWPPARLVAPARGSLLDFRLRAQLAHQVLDLLPHEALQVTYDPRQVSYEKLLETFWVNHDPTTLDSQFCDHGSQYRPGIFYHDAEQKRLAEASKANWQKDKPFRDRILTPIEPAAEFWPAEEYHQDYYKKNPARYRFYVTGCSRYPRLDQLWGKYRAK